MVCGGVWWFVVVCGGLFWCVEVCGSVWWFVVVCGGLWWCVVVFDGVWWFVVVFGGVSFRHCANTTQYFFKSNKCIFECVSVLTCDFFTKFYSTKIKQ